MPGLLGREIAVPFFKSIWNEHGLPLSGIVVGAVIMFFFFYVNFCSVSRDLCLCALFILGIIMPAQVRLSKVSLPSIRACKCN